jgi:SAM-dependent methyltransferase
MAAHSVRDQRYARVVDREVAPLWHDRFARLLWRHLPALPDDALVLDVHSGPGHTAGELLERLGSTVRVVALEPQETLRNLAKARLSDFSERVYVKPGDIADITEMADATYDLVVANLVLGEAQDLGVALRELLRVTRAGGSVLLTLPMDGSWVEVEDLFREVLRGADQKDAARRLRHLARLRPTGYELAKVAADLGIGQHHFVIEQERFNLLFKSGREFLFAPVIELGPLRMWKAILGQQAAPQELFWQLKESIDAYFSDSVFSVSVVAGVLHLRKPAPGAAGAQAAVETSGAYWGHYPELDALWQQAERLELEDEELDLDIDVDEEPAASRAVQARPGDADVHPVDDGGDIDDVDDVATSASSASSSSRMDMNAEDEAIFALLEAPSRDADSELDALLDQVLEFAGTEEPAAPPAAPPPGLIDELVPEALLQIAPVSDVKTKPGDTLTRIRSLLPPPPGADTPAPPNAAPRRGPSRPPPPPAGKLSKKR